MNTTTKCASQIQFGDKIVLSRDPEVVVTVTCVELGADKDWVHVAGQPSPCKIAVTLGGLEVVTQ